MAKKTVLYKIKVPDGKYCWEHLPPHEICEHFNNEGGHSECELGFCGLKDIDEGVIKSPECSKLQKAE
jgi:hypothetical protein